MLHLGFGEKCFFVKAAVTNVTTILIIYGNIWNGLVLGHRYLLLTGSHKHPVSHIRSFSLFIYAEALSNTRTHYDGCIRSNLAFSILHKDTLESRLRDGWPSAPSGWVREGGRTKTQWTIHEVLKLQAAAPDRRSIEPLWPLLCAHHTQLLSWAWLGPMGTYWSITYESIIRVWVMNDTADTKGQKEFPTCLSDPFFFVKVLFI